MNTWVREWTVATAWMLPLNLPGALARTGTDLFSLITTNMMPSTSLSLSLCGFLSVSWGSRQMCDVFQSLQAYERGREEWFPPIWKISRKLNTATCLACCLALELVCPLHCMVPRQYLGAHTSMFWVFQGQPQTNTRCMQGLLSVCDRGKPVLHLTPALSPQTSVAGELQAPCFRWDLIDWLI